MTFAIATIGAMIGLVGVTGVWAPAMVSRALDGVKSSPRKIYGSAGVRFVVGVVLMVGASGTALPTVIRLMGAVLILQAALIPILGVDQVRSLIDWYQARSPLVMRLLLLAVASFGAFLLWAALRP